EHRWARGDWQLLPWLGRHVPVPAESGAASAGRKQNPLPMVQRWKIFDNLRRSLVPPALVALLLLAWTRLPGSAWLWSAFVLLVLGLPVLLQVLGSLLAVIRGGAWKGSTQELREDIPATGGQALLSLVFLADQARLMADAVSRTLYRLFVSRRHLLEWET